MCVYSYNKHSFVGLRYVISVILVPTTVYRPLRYRVQQSMNRMSVSVTVLVLVVYANALEFPSEWEIWKKV